MLPRGAYGRLPASAVRFLAWLCLILLVLQSLGTSLFAATPPPPVPVVTNITGQAAVRSPNGSTRDIVSSQIVRNGDMLVTGIGSLAVLNYSDAGRIRLGPATTATTTLNQNDLSLRINSGSLCVDTQRPILRIQAGALSISAGDDETIFDLMRDTSKTTVAVYRGQIEIGINGKSSSVLKAGQAAVASHDGVPEEVAIDSVTPSFSALRCPDPEIIAQANPAEPSPAPHSGGGGGGGIIGILLGLGALGALAGHGGGGGGGGNNSSPPPVPSPSPSPGSLTVAPGSLSFIVGGAAQQFSASESNYSGKIKAKSGDVTVATVSPASGSGPSANFSVTPVGPGSTTITVKDDLGKSQTVSITVTPPGTLSVNPGSLSFITAGAPQQITANESSYNGPINATSLDTTVATVSGSGTGPGPVIFTVTPVAAGNTHIRVTDNHGGSKDVSITVVGPLTTDTNSLTFVGTTSSKNFTATDPNYSGAITAMSSDVTVATVLVQGSPNGPGPVTFRVTPVAQGNASITVSDTFGGSTVVHVSVSTGSLIINPTSLTLIVGGPTQTFTGSEANYTGPISAASSDTSKATVSPASGSGPGPVTFTVTPVAAGDPTIAVTDNHGSPTQFVQLTITGPISAAPSSLTFNGTTAAQNINVTDPNYSGTINAVSGDTSVAIVTPSASGPSAVFSVTPVSRGTTTITFSDVNGSSKVANVTVIAGPLNVSPNSLTINGAGSSLSFSASETDYTGLISASSNDTGVATVSPSSGNGPGPVNFTVTGAGAGSTTITVADNHGGLQSVNITVLAPLSVSTNNITLTQQTPTSSFTASEAGYGGPINAASDNLGVATVSPASGTGPGPVTFNVSSVSPGTAHITVTDNHGGLQIVTITVAGPLTVSTNSLNFTATSQNQNFSASEINYAGPINVVSNDTTVVTVSPASQTGPGPDTFTATSVGPGTTTISVTDNHGSTQTINVAVDGPLTVSTNTITLNASTTSQQFTSSEVAYSGLISAASTNTGVVTVSPASGSGPGPVTFTVTEVGTGTAGINVTDDHGGAQTINVTVEGPLTVTTNTLSINGIGNTAPFTASESNYSGLISAASSNTSVATVAPASGSGPSVGFTVTAVAAGNANMNVTDDHAGAQTVLVSVTTGNMSISQATVMFANSGSAPVNITATDPSATNIFATSADTSIATVSPAFLPGPSGTFSVSPGINTGRTTITFDDHMGGVAVLSVGVGVSPLVKKKPVVKPHSSTPTPAPKGLPTPKPRPRIAPIIGPVRPLGAHPSPMPTFGNIPGTGSTSGPSPLGAITVSSSALLFNGRPSPQTVFVSEANYSSAFNAISTNPNVASISPTAMGPSATFVITPRSSGSAIIKITDNHGGSRDITVIVRLEEPRTAPMPAPGKPPRIP